MERAGNDGEDGGHAGRGRGRLAGPVLVLGCIAAVFLLRWPVRSAYLFNWDAANHALATLDWDIIKHQPHPPGYPLWVLLTRGLAACGLSANTAQLVWTQVSCGLALAAVWATARRARRTAADAGGGWAGPLAATVTLFSPLVLLYSTVAGTYTAELMTSAVTGWFVVRMWDERRLSPALWGCVAWAACAGLRTSGSVFTAPLLLVGLVRACGARPGHWLACGLAGLATGLAWLLPVLREVGGPRNYKLLNEGLFRAPFEAHSVLYGGPPEAHLLMATRVSTWMLFAVAVPLVLWVVAAPARRRVPAASGTRAPWHRWWFYVLWGAPCLLFSLLVFGDIPGYLMAAFPPAAVALGVGLSRGTAPLAVRARLAPARRWVAHPVRAILLVAFGGLLLARLDYDRARAARDVPAALGARVAAALDASSMQQVRRSDAVMAAVTGAVRGADVPPERALVLVLDVTLTSANFRKLAWHLPELPVAWLSGSRPALMVARDRRTDDRRSLDVEPGRRRLWIVAQQPELPAPLAAAFPEAERRLHLHALGLWAVDLAPGPWERELVYGPQRFVLRRR